MSDQDITGQKLDESTKGNPSPAPEKQGVSSDDNLNGDESPNSDNISGKDKKSAGSDKPADVDNGDKIKINGRNVPIHKGGIQNNYFNALESKKIICHNLSGDDIESMCKPCTFQNKDAYINLLNQKRWIILYGDKGIGKSTLALSLLSHLGLRSVTCFYEINRESFNEYGWQKNTGYIYEYPEDNNLLSKIALVELGRKLSNAGAYLILTVLPSVLYSLEADLREHAMFVEIPSERAELIKKRVVEKFEADGCILNDKARNDIEDICDHPIFGERIKHLKTMDDFARLSIKIYQYLTQNTNEALGTMVNSILTEFERKEDWREKMEQITDIQEKIFMLTVAFLSGFSRDMIGEAFLSLQAYMLPKMSKVDKEAVENSVFWSEKWDYKLERIGAYAGECYKTDTEFKEKTLTVNMPGDNANKVISYFLSQYDWKHLAENWLLYIAFSNISTDENFIVCRALAKLDRFGISGLMEKLIDIYIKAFDINSETDIDTCVCNIAILLRCIHDNAEEPENRLKAKLFLHRRLTSNDLLDSLLGCSIYSYGFSDLELPNIEKDFLTAYKKHPGLPQFIARAFSDLIFFHEESSNRESSLIRSIVRNPDLWKREDLDLVFYIIKNLNEYSKSRWFKSQKKSYSYPFFLYLFAGNPKIRDELVEFVVKAIKTPPLDKEMFSVFEHLYRVTRKKRETYKMEEIYHDFVQLIMQKDTYSYKYIKGQEEWIDKT